MGTGVVVVGLDDVAQHQGGPTVGAVELEQALQAPVALAREQRQQREQRHRRERGDRGRVEIAATASAIPDSPASIAYTQVSESCALRLAPRVFAKRSVETVKSTANCAISASTSSAAPACSGSTPATANTATGPIANQQFPTVSRARRYGRSPLNASGTCASSSAIRTAKRHERHRQREQQRNERQLSRGREAERGVEPHARGKRHHQQARGAVSTANAVWRSQQPDPRDGGEEAERDRPLGAAFAQRYRGARASKRVG